MTTEVIDALQTCWATLDEPTGKRLAPGLPELVAALRRHGELQIDDATAALLCSMSAAAIDRRLAAEREKLHGTSHAAQPSHRTAVPAHLSARVRSRSAVLQTSICRVRSQPYRTSGQAWYAERPGHGAVQGQPNSSRARRTAWARSRSWSLANRLLMWVLTVEVLTNEPFGDLGVGEPVADQPEHLLLAAGQLGEALVGRALAARSLAGRFRPAHRAGPSDVGAGSARSGDESGGDGPIEGGLAAGDRPDRHGDVLTRGVLGQVAAGARAQRPADRGVVGVRRQDQHRGLRKLRQQGRRGVGAVQLRHPQIHQHHVGPQPAGSARAPAARSPPTRPRPRHRAGTAP